MNIYSKNLCLKFLPEPDCEITALVENVDELFNMSEVRLYPPGMPKELIYKIEQNNILCGEIRLKNLRWFNRKAEISIILKKEFHGKGYGEEAMISLIKYAFEKMNLHRIEAEVIEYNKPSISLVEKLGFKLEGTFREAKYNEGKYWSVLKFGLLRKEFNL